MLNNILFSFFFGMPAIVAIFVSRDMTSPAARIMYFWGGCGAALLAFVTLAPMFLCSGSLLNGFTNCRATGLTNVISANHGLILLAAKTYLFVGPALALAGYGIESKHKRRARKA